LHKIGTDESFILDSYLLDEFFTKDNKPLSDYEIVESDGTTWQVVGVGIDDRCVCLETRRLKPETTVATMGCRTRVIGNKNGKEQTTSRGNLAFHTLNLPKLAIQAHIESQDPAERKKIFFKKLQSLLEDAKQSLIDRYNLIAKKTYENFPFTMQQGLYLTSDDEPHKLTDTIGEVLKQGTLSIGYIGIYETLLLLTGKVWGKDEELKSYGIEIVKYIHDFCKKCEKTTDFNWSCFATPAESVAGRFCNIDKNIYQGHPMLEDVDQFQLFDKGYYTNSHMLPYDLDTTLANKVAWEAPLHELTTAGHIFYHKIDGDLSQNIDAVKKCIDYMYEKDLGYFTVTMDSDTCINKLPDGSTCGFHGVIDKECPKCGCTCEDYFIRVRRITGYLTGSPRKSISKSWNDGKLAELKNRKNI
jgi:ribonucleoside-triphosphate reductase